MSPGPTSGLAPPRRLALALLAGALSVLAIRPGPWGWLAWIALAPLFVALEGASARAVIALAISYTVVLGVGAVGPWLLPGAVKYFQLSVWRAAVCTVVFLTAASAVHGVLLGLLLLLRPRGPSTWAVLWYGAVWACWEALRKMVFPYYPAALLPLSQHEALAAIQVASLGGIAGVTFALVACNVGLAVLLGQAPGGRSRAMMAAATGLAIAGGTVGWGAWRLATGTRQVESQLLDPPFSPGPSIATVDINAMQRGASTLERYLEASRAAAATGPGLLIWPESALTTDIEHDRAAWAQLAAFVADVGIPLLAGGPGSARRSGPGFARFNSAHLVYPSRGLRSYHKRDLVPLAERWPSYLGQPPSDIESLDAGLDLPVFTVGEWGFGVLICFEIGDARGARSLAQRGAHFIVNPTNDAWFYGVAPHLPWAVLRAVESGLPVVRAANAGLSAVIDRFGRLVRVSEPRGGPVLLAAKVPAARPTFYARHGELFLRACGIILIVGMIGAGVERSRSRRRRLRAARSDGHLAVSPREPMNNPG